MELVVMLTSATLKVPSGVLHVGDLQQFCNGVMSPYLFVAGVSRELLSGVLFLSDKTSTMHWYNTLLAERLIRIISTSCQPRECF
jgi:hypothetical protein